MKRIADWRWVLVAAAIVLWAFIVLGAYYVVHKPFDLANVTALLASALDLLFVAGVLCISAAIGSRGLAAGLDVSPLERLILAIGLGLGLIGLAVLGLGLLGLLYRWVFWLLWVLGVAISARRTGVLLRQVLAKGIELPAGRLYRFLACVVGLVLLLSLFQALMPATAWDSLTYQLTEPRLSIEAHRLAPVIELPFLGFPALMRMLFTAGLLLKGAAVAQLLHWSTFALVVGLLYAVGRRYFDARTAWLSMALICSVPSIVLISSWAYVDVALMFFSLAAVYALLRWRDSVDIHWLPLSGVFCGFAIGTKYTAVGLAAALVIAVLWQVRSAGWRKTAVSLLLLGGVAFAVSLPWLLRNWAWTGNPVAPFLFDSASWDALRQQWYGRPGTGLAYTAPAGLLVAPWNMTIFGTEGKQGFSATIGPLLLIGLGALVVVWKQASGREKRILSTLGLISLVQYAIWLYGVATSSPLMQTRLLFPIFPLVALLAGYGIARLGVLRRPGFAVDWVIDVVLVISLGLGLLGLTLQAVSDNPLAVIAGIESREDYLERHLGSYYTAMQHINRELPAGSRVYFLWETRGYYCERNFRPDSVLDAFKSLTSRFGRAGPIAQYLRDEGYTHVLLCRKGLDFVLGDGSSPLDETDLRKLDELARDYWVETYRDGQDYVLYETGGSHAGP